MSLPHECECRICGNKMNGAFGQFKFDYNNPKLTGAAVIDVCNQAWMCTKHGPMLTSNCLKCAEEQKGPAV